MKRFWKDVTGHLSYAIYAAKSELKSEVANSYLNWIWWVLEPFCFMLIYSFIFGTVFNAKEPHFGLFIFVGLTAWDFFQRNVVQSVKLLKNNKAIVTKVYIPKFVLLISRMFFNGYKMFISFGIVAIMMVYYRIHLTWHIIFVIPTFILLCTLSFALMTHLMHYGVYVQDLTNVTTITLRMIFYMSGIFFNLEKRVPAQAAAILLKCNPMALILNSFRSCILYGNMPNLKWMFIWFVISVIIAIFGVRKIYRNENSYVKVI